MVALSQGQKSSEGHLASARAVALTQASSLTALKRDALALQAKLDEAFQCAADADARTSRGKEAAGVAAKKAEEAASDREVIILGSLKRALPAC